ncbi:MAG TPA: hypothetical protein VH915_09005 [Pedococcus sp.]|jgi:hypothetical protein
MDTATQLVFLAVVAGRFLLPLLIPRFPLPAILACLVLDGIDQSIFQAFGYDPPGYQGYDKAMDVFYLCVAYLSMLRNWTSRSAFEVGRFLYFYRLVGVLLFELTQWRPLLLVFPNTFEYFFIAYEVARLRWDPRRRSPAFWIWTAALIWVVVKLPQEWWIHIAQLDFTDTVAEVPWFGPAVVLALLALAAVLWFAVRPRLPEADWPWRVPADPLPAQMDQAHERAAWVASHYRVLSVPTFEKVVLVGLISVIYALVLPGTDVDGARLFVGLTGFVLVNAALALWAARAARSVESLAGAFAARVAVNIGLVVLADRLVGGGGDRLDAGAAVFFVVLLSLITTLHDRFWPVHEVRAELAQDPRAPATP